MSAEDLSLNGKITRTGSDESETAAGDIEAGLSETFSGNKAWVSKVDEFVRVLY